MLTALNSRHLQKKTLSLPKKRFQFNGYSFTDISTSSFSAGGYCFIEREFHWENPSSVIDGIYFYIYYTKTGIIAARIYEKVKQDNEGNFKLHYFYDQKDSKYDQLNIHFYYIITNSLITNKTLQLIKPHVDMLQNCVLNLPSYEDIDIEAPQQNDSVVYIPIEGTYNARFFTRLFLLRHHTIENIIVSPFDMIQYQIPVKADNESLILLVYGTHLLDYLMSPETLIEPIGFSKCINSNTRIREHSPIVDSIFSVRELVDGVIENRDSITHDALYEKFEWLVSRVFSWIYETMDIAKDAYRKTNYSQVKWISEYKLFNLIKLWYPDAVFQFSPVWLNKQSIDIFLPSKHIGIEYQGRQHFESIDYFGGDEVFRENTRRDNEKLRVCKENGVTILCWKYNQKVTFSAVSKFLNEFPINILEQLESFEAIPVETILGKTYTFAQAEKKKRIMEKKAAQSHLIEVVRQYSNTGEYIAEYSSLKKAAIQTNTNITSIQKCLAGDRKTAGGYIWRREKKENKPQAIKITQNETSSIPITNSNGFPKPVIQIDPISGEAIMIHDSITQAAKSVGINSKGISDTIKGKQKTAGGYSWQFANQDKKSSS